MKNKLAIALIGIIEILIGVVTFVAVMMSLAQGINTKPFHVISFVLLAAVCSAGLGVGLLLYDAVSYRFLIFFSVLIMVTKVLLFAGIMHFPGALEIYIPAQLKDAVSFVYHWVIVAYLSRPHVRALIIRHQDAVGLFADLSPRAMARSLAAYLKEKQEVIFSKAEYILAVLALASLFLYIFQSMLHELGDPDIWLHLKAGKYILANRAVPIYDIFSQTLAAKPWVDHSWLVQVAYYALFSAGGPNALLMFSAWTMVIAFLVLLVCIYQDRDNLVLAVGLFFLAVFASIIRYNIRPENMSVLCFAVYLFIIVKGTSNKWLYGLIPIQLLWVNVHGFFIIGPLLLTLFLTAEMARRFVPLPWGWNQSGRLDNRTLASLCVVYCAVWAVCFINPYGYKGVSYPFEIMVNSSRGAYDIF